MKGAEDEASLVEEPKSGEENAAAAGSSPWQVRWAKTGLFCLVMFVVGFQAAIPGPTLKDLVDIYGSNLETMSFIFTAKMFGYLLGAMAGFVANVRILSDVHVCLLSLLLGLTVSLVPHCQLVPLVMLDFFANGFVLGILRPGMYVCCLRMWDKGKSGPPMHALSFALSLGCLLAPVLARPFLGDGSAGSSRIGTVFPVVGSVNLAVAAGFLVFWLKGDAGGTDSGSAGQREGPETRSSTPSRPWSLVVLKVAVASQYLLMVPMMWALALLAASFSVEGLGLTRAEGADVTTVFWLAVTASRLAAIWLSLRTRPQLTMAADLALIVAPGSYVLWRGPGIDSLAFKACVALMGLGFGPMYSTMLLVYEEYAALGGRTMTVFSTSEGLGMKLFPMLGGQLVAWRPMALFYMILGLTWVNVGSYLVTLAVGPRVRTAMQGAHRRLPGSDSPDAE